MKKNTFRIAILLTTSVACFAAPAPVGRNQSFPVSQDEHVPGATLHAGSYTIKEVDHLPDRSILRIESKDGATHATFIAIGNPKLSKPGHPGPLLWNGTSGEQYVRGWLFPGERTVLEFFYPKNDAVAIANQVNAPVPAVDPESEHMKPAPDAVASKSDMEIINLWLLSAERTGPADSKPEIKAVKYVASNSASEPKAASVPRRLPKTASGLPAVLGMGLAFLALAGAVRRFGKTKLETN